MKQFLQAKQQAESRFKMADHMLTQTYPSLNDPKILQAIIENLFLSATSAISALLHFEHTQRRIPLFVENFDIKLELFRQVARRYEFPQEFVATVEDLKDILIAQKNSPIERKDMFLIQYEDNRMKAIKIDDVKKYLQLTKRLLAETAKITKIEAEQLR